jgi:hypothetical protein
MCLRISVARPPGNILATIEIGQKNCTSGFTPFSNLYFDQELMKMMGLPSWMHWLCWYLNCATTSIISIIIMVALVSISFSSG